ncbi:MAG TPA: hypothetical protein VMF30_14935 [Pirellulales bacterium]|nr:hypothetical protein [Pirellulales bacterium]
MPVLVPDVPESDVYDPALLDRTLENNRLVESEIRTEVENDLRQARLRMAASPHTVEDDLKLALEEVRKAPELSVDVRAQLEEQLETALRESARRAVEKDQRDIEFEQTQAQAEERLRITQALERRQEKLRQLMDRFDSLMAEGRYLLAEETAAYEVQKLAPNDPISVSAAKVSSMVRYAKDIAMVRLARQKGYVDAMFQAELAFVPFPDDQPIVYPDAQMWEEMGALRKKWKDYASVDLKDQEGPTARIQKALDEETSFDFTELPLDQVVAYLKDKHGIEIQLDTKVLEEASIGIDTPVTRSLSGITLRSALRLMLGALDLTYVIKDEVLLITTPDKANNELQTKVYPVADLVMPIPRTGMMGGGMMGRGMGGGMMGGGMMGGGMMGGGMMGGGMGGMGGMGMGGGMF